MFEKLTDQPVDPILSLIALFRDDTRVSKVDLGIGVYRNEEGKTPVMRSIKKAELNIWQTQNSKAYLAPEGDAVFLNRLWSLVGGEAAHPVHCAGVQAIGGSGALRLGAELAKLSGTRQIWLGLPSWPNHSVIFGSTGLDVQTYAFFDAATQTVLFDVMTNALQGASAGDLVLLHASCHNPTGASLSLEQWRTITNIIATRGLLPIIDLAYQGFGKGLEADVEGLRLLIASVPEAIVAVSCSKTFGLYLERTGAIFAVGRSRSSVEAAKSNLISLARALYSMPPDHGSAIVRTILDDAILTQEWKAELETMRERLNILRKIFAEQLSLKSPTFSAIGRQEGMFALLPLGTTAVLSLRSEFGIYLPTSGRINIAGLKIADAAATAAKMPL